MRDSPLQGALAASQRPRPGCASLPQPHRLCSSSVFEVFKTLNPKDCMQKSSTFDIISLYISSCTYWASSEVLLHLPSCQAEEFRLIISPSLQSKLREPHYLSSPQVRFRIFVVMSMQQCTWKLGGRSPDKHPDRCPDFATARRYRLHQNKSGERRNLHNCGPPRGVRGQAGDDALGQARIAAQASQLPQQRCHQ